MKLGFSLVTVYPNNKKVRVNFVIKLTLRVKNGKIIVTMLALVGELGKCCNNLNN